MAANTAIVQANVQRILSDSFHGVELWKGGFTLRNDSARLFIRVVEQETRVLVKLTCPLVTGCVPTPELFKHVALHADDYLFGHLSVEEDEDKVGIFFTHILLGDYLDDEELKQAVGGVLGVADEIDEELEKLFGGERFHGEQ